MDALRESGNPDNEERKQAEAILREATHDAGYPSALL